MPPPTPSPSPATPATPPPILLVTGVSGSGKSTIGMLLAQHLGWRYAEGDSFHPPANVAKMAAGHPLDDADRAPWLAAIGAWIDESAAAGLPGVISCSALKRAYRDTLRTGRPQVRLIYLDADEQTIAARLAARTGHFFPAALVASQFGTLEPPREDEYPLREPVGDDAPEDVTARILAQLGILN